MKGDLLELWLKNRPLIKLLELLNTIHERNLNNHHNTVIRDRKHRKITYVA